MRLFVIRNVSDAPVLGAGRLTVGNYPVQRSGALARAQFRFWFWHERCPVGSRGFLNRSDTWSLDGQGKTASAVLAILQQLLARHEALRTTYSFDVSGQPVQRIHEPPVLDWEEVNADAETGSSGSPTISRFVSQLTGQEFELETELPFRAALIVDGTSAVRMRVVFHHSLIDFQGIIILRDEFRTLIAGASVPRVEDLWHAVDQASDERSAAGQERGAAALDAVTAVYERMPHRLLSGLTAEAAEPRYRVLRMDSGRAKQALRSVSSRLRVTQTSILVAGYMTLLSILSGSRHLAVLVPYSNRHSLRFRRSVMCLVQDVPVCHDISPDVHCSGILKEIDGICLSQYKHANYAPDEVEERRSVIEYSRGVCFSLGISINYLTQAADAGMRVSPGDGAEIHARGFTGSLSWADPLDSGPYQHDLELTVTDRLHFLTFELNVNTGIVRPAVSEALFRGLVKYLSSLAAGMDPTVSELGRMAGLAGPALGARWRETDHCLINLDEVRSVVLQHPMVADCAVFARRDDVRGASLTAYVHAPGGLTASALRRFVMTRLCEHPAAAVPHAFIFAGSVPRDPGSEADWLELAVVSPAPGRLPGPLEPAGASTVGGIAASLGALAAPDADRSYLEQGGRLAAIPAIVRRLRLKGMEHTSPEDFLGHRPLAEISVTAAGHAAP